VREACYPEGEAAEVVVDLAVTDWIDRGMLVAARSHPDRSICCSRDKEAYAVFVFAGAGFCVWSGSSCPVAQRLFYNAP